MVQRAPDLVFIGENAGRLPGTMEEMPERFSAIGERVVLAGLGWGRHGHGNITTPQDAPKFSA
jgi:hypothetical protein